jgi:hypothetical protein
MCRDIVTNGTTFLCGDRQSQFFCILSHRFYVTGDDGEFLSEDVLQTCQRFTVVDAEGFDNLLEDGVIRVSMVSFLSVVELFRNGDWFRYDFPISRMNSSFYSAVVVAFSVLLPLSLPSSGADQQEYLPLKVGNEWTMDAEFTSTQGEVSKGTVTQVVVETVERDGKMYFRERTSMEGGPFQKEQIILNLARKDDKGFYSISESRNEEKEQLEIILPLVVGQSWERSMGKMKLKDTVVGLENVAIGEDTYQSCYHIRSESTDGTFKEDFWEAPKLGPIKFVMIYGSGAKISMTLREFRPAKE